MSKKNKKLQSDSHLKSVESSSTIIDFLNNKYLHVFLFLFLTVFLFRDFLFSDKVLSSSDQLASIDIKTILINNLRHGQLPMWFSSRLGGMPSIDASFGDAMYLPSMFFYKFFPLHRALGLRMVFHVFLAGLFFYLMLKKGFKLSPLVSCVGASLYMLNPEFVSHVYPGHDGKMYVIAWLPFIVWRLKVMLESPNVLNMTFLSFGIAMSEFTSHTQMTYFAMWGLFFYWVMWTFLRWNESKKINKIMSPGIFFWLAVFLGLGMAFIQFFPVYSFVGDGFSVRGVDKGFDFASSWSLHWPEFFSLWIPEFGGYLRTYWSENPFKLNTEYAGAVVLLLSVISVIYKTKPWRIFWLSVALFATFFALGAHTPVFNIAYYIVPGVKKMRACSMIMFWYSFPIVLLTSLFLNDIFSGEFFAMEESKKKKWQKNLLIMIGVFTFITIMFSMKGFSKGIMQSLLSQPLSPNKERALDYNLQNSFLVGLWLWWFWSSATLYLLWIGLKGKLNKSTFILLILLIGIIDTFRVDSHFISVISKRSHFSNEPVLNNLQKNMATNPFRCFSLPGTLPQNGEGYYGLEGVGDFNDNELLWYKNFRGDSRNSNYLRTLLSYGSNGQPFLTMENLQKGNNFLDLANVRYILTRSNGKIVPIENINALGRISFVPNYVVLDSAQIIHALVSNKYDISTTVALYKEPHNKPKNNDTVDSFNSQVTWQKYTTNYRKATITCPQDGFVRISEVYYPGWKIKIDGVDANILRADGAWMAVFVNSGKHTIEMIPHSLYLAKAEVISWPLIAMVLLFWIFTVVMSLKKRNKKVSDD